VTGVLTAVLVTAVISGVGAWWVAQRATGRRHRTAPAEERARQVERLAEVVVDLTGTLDRTEMLNRLARSASELVGADASAFARLDDGHSTIVATHRLPERLVGFTIGRGEGLMSDVVERGEVVVIDDYHQHPGRVEGIVEAIPGLHTVAAVPSVIDGNVSAALFVLFREPGHTLSHTALDVLRLLAGHAGTAHANIAMYSEVVRREAHEQAVVEALADGVAVIGPDGLVTSWNSAAATMTGMPVTDVVGTAPPVPVPPFGQPVEHELPGDRWLEILASQLPETGETVLVLRDVSEQKALERAQSLFLATTTHEIKTPLTVVSGFATTLQRRWDELKPDDRERALSAIVRRSEALVKLIDQLLLGFRVQAGQLDLDLRGLDLRSVLETAVAGFDTLSERHPVTLDIDDELPLVIGDGRAVDQVLAQLLENAIKYSPEGGPIGVAARASDGVVRITVRDAGVGLQPGEGDRVFSRYFRGAGKDHRKVGGVGLGLYIVRQLVEAQGGTVAASGDEGKGAVFEFTLPIAR
jgi:nitrogen fixation/metabolism regulation signal transduction histidine kinase